jgi:hypothetical protein
MFASHAIRLAPKGRVVTMQDVVLVATLVVLVNMLIWSIVSIVLMRNL